MVDVDDPDFKVVQHRWQRSFLLSILQHYNWHTCVTLEPLDFCSNSVFNNPFLKLLMDCIVEVDGANVAGRVRFSSQRSTCCYAAAARSLSRSYFVVCTGTLFKILLIVLMIHVRILY